MAELVFTLFVVALALVAASIVAIVSVTGLRLMMPKLEAAIGTSMFIMGVVLYSAFPGLGSLRVVGLVVVSHAVAAGLIWYRRKLQSR